MAFDIGDTVKLKSDGPLMTVVKNETQGGHAIVVCSWFEKSQLRHGSFPPEALVKAEKVDFKKIARQIAAEEH